MHRIAILVSVSSMLLGTSCGFATGAAACPDGSTPLGRRKIDVSAYETANRQLLDGLPLAIGEATTIEQHPYTDCADGEGKLAGVVSVATYPVVPGTKMCAVAEPIEAALGGDGWSALALETDDPTSDGNIRSVDFWKGAAHLTLSLSGEPTSFALFVDHDVPEEARPSGGISIPCS